MLQRGVKCAASFAAQIAVQVSQPCQGRQGGRHTADIEQVEARQAAAQARQRGQAGGRVVAAGLECKPSQLRQLGDLRAGTFCATCLIRAGAAEMDVCEAFGPPTCTSYKLCSCSPPWRGPQPAHSPAVAYQYFCLADAAV